jgi:hypothetical protein
VLIINQLTDFERCQPAEFKEVKKHILKAAEMGKLNKSKRDFSAQAKNSSL